MPATPRKQPDGTQTWSARVSRRALLRSGLASLTGLAAVYALGCDDGEGGATATPQPAAGSPSPGPSPTPRTAAPTWRRLEPAGELPAPRRDHALVADAAGRRVYLFGGRAGAAALNDLWIYDVEAWSWSQAAGNGPSPRFGHNAAFDPRSGRVLVFGGQAGSSFFSDVWAYDTRAGAWTRLAAEAAGPLARYGAGSAYDPDARALYVTHGFTTDGRFDDTWGFAADGAGWEDVSPAGGERPVKRCLLRAVVDPDRGRLLLFGGQTDGNPYLGDLWAYDLTGRSWARLGAEGPSPRNLYALVRRDDAPHALLFGGRARDGDTADLWQLDLTADRWSQVTADGEAPAARSSHDAVWLPGRNAMLLFGGRAGSEDLNDLWELSFA